MRDSNSADRQPDETRLTEVLAGAKRHWDSLLNRLRSNHPAVTAEWKCYSTGWRLVLRDKRRNLAYLKPSQEHFVVSFALSDEAVDAAGRSDLPRRIVSSIRDSKKFPEGRAARIEVASTSDVSHAATIFAIKMAH